MNRNHTQRGSVLVGSVAIAAIAAMSLGVALVLNSSYNRSTYVKSDSEAALLLAEAGINEELNRISTNITAGGLIAASAPSTLTSEPYPGRKGTVEGTEGTYWVYGSSDPDGTIPWDGSSDFYITSNAVVNNSWRRARIGGPNANPFQSPFGTFALFGLDSASSSNRPNIGLTGNAEVQVIGGAGTNGRMQGGSGTITYTSAVNYNAGAYASSPHEQFVGGNVSERNDKLVLPTVVDVIKQTIPAASRMTDQQAWAHLKANNDNVGGAKMWKTGLSAGATLSPSNVVSARWPATGGGAYNMDNLTPDGLARWNNRNLAPGSSTKRTLIFQPGDYYFEEIGLRDNVDTEIIIDTAGLTVVGGNPSRRPVRFFVAGTGSDKIEIQVKQTDPSDSPGLRIYYGKPGGMLSLYYPASAPSGSEWVTSLIVYAVTAPEASGNGTEIDVNGDDSGWLTIKGSLIADRVGFKKRCKIIGTGENMTRALDPISGVGFAGGYNDD